MYTAQSVISALKANEELSCEGIDRLGCPSPMPNPHEGCNGDPKNCDLCKSQNCKQPVSVHRKLQKLTVLNFMYMISLQNQDGFIRKNDSSLRRLIDHKFIDKNLLKSVG